jgi:hypothetical protein
MIFLIIISLIIISVALVITIGFRQVITFNYPIWLTLLSFTLLIAASLLIFFSESHISEGFERKKWPLADARIIKTAISGERAFQPEVHVTYLVSDTNYTIITNLNTPGFGSKRYRKNTANKIIGEYPIGSRMKVFYNPGNPGEAYIRTGPYWTDYIQLALGIIISDLSLIVLLGSLLKKITKESNIRF